MEHLRSLQILNELSENDSLIQRDISKQLGFALGLVNSYIKNLSGRTQRVSLSIVLNFLM
jgi:predicted transcriptional regulator